jgi:hypothetical protein
MHPKAFLVELCIALHRTKMVVLSMPAIPFVWRQFSVLIEIQLLFLG